MTTNMSTTDITLRCTWIWLATHCFGQWLMDSLGVRVVEVVIITIVVTVVMVMALVVVTAVVVTVVAAMMRARKQAMRHHFDGADSPEHTPVIGLRLSVT